MPEIIAQSVAKRVPLKVYLADGVTPATGKTVACVISKNMAAFTNPSAGATNLTEVSNGWYYVDLSTTDAGTLGPLIVRATVTGCDDSEAIYTVAVVSVAQTGDAFARLGAAGAGLTALGDTRIANLDAAVSSRTKPADTQAAVTTVTNLTNAPTAGDFTAAMKTSLNAATPAVTVSDKTGFALTAAYDAAKTAAQVSDIPTAAQNADKLLGRSLATGADGGRTVQDAMRILRNRRAIVAGTLTAYAEDDTTPAWTAVVATTASNPVNSIDPA